MEFGGCTLLSKHHSNCQGFNWETKDKHQIGETKGAWTILRIFKSNTYQIIGKNNIKYRLYQAEEALKHTAEPNGKAWKKHV